uniref:Retrotransposon gag domain-containing protein n=1 Tax=Cajanus cajan TaxID=3821 RepID=A0A151RT08_CAJCA|nr:hypothetical protein KK1_032780 [Cajanus cajan]
MSRSLEKIHFHEEGEGSVGQQQGSGGRPRILEGEAIEEFRQSVKKIELPMFNGEDPAGWITRAEIYFRVQETSEVVKVSLAQLCMEGGTIHFFNALLNDQGDLSWEDLKRELLARYGGLGEGSVFEQLTAIRQNGSVDEYIQKFESLVAQIPKLHDEQYFAYFIHGLQDEIRSRLRSMHVANPLTRGRMMNTARAVEMELANRGDTNGPGPNSRLEGGGRNKIGQRDRGTKHLAYQDLLDRRQRGLCYKCGGPYGPLHQCPVKQLRLILVDDELQVECEKDEEKVEQRKEEDKSESEGECSSIWLHGLEKERNQSLNTMKLRGQVRGIPLFVLVDSGATHNFISKKLVEAMGWSWEPTKSMNILMGDGHKSETSGVCRGLRVETTAGEFTVDAFLFELGDIDMILGMSWLVSLGEMVVDWNKQSKIRTKARIFSFYNVIIKKMQVTCVRVERLLYKLH